MKGRLRWRNGPHDERPFGAGRIAAALILFAIVPLLAGCFGGGSKERKGALTTATEKRGVTPPGGTPSQAGPVGPPSQQHVPAEAKSGARAKVAQRENVPTDRLDLASATKVTLPLQGEIAYQVKFLDTKDNSIHGVAVDANGDSVDLDKLVADEQRASSAKYGKLDPALAEALKNAPAQEAIAVAILLTEPGYAPPPRPEATPIDPNDATKRRQASLAAQAAKDRAVEKRMNKTKSLTDPVAARIRSLDPAASADDVVPAFYAHLTPADIQAAAKFPEVEQISLSGKGRNQLEVAKPTVGAGYVNSLGINGAGVRIAEVEVGGKVDTSNPKLTGIAVDPNATVCYPSSFPPHSTGVAGILHAAAGIAPGASLLTTGACNGGSSDLRARASYAATTWGANVQNHSWGWLPQYETNLSPNTDDNYYDWLVTYTFTTFVFAAANEGQRTGWVMSPGRAYNVITVGNYDDKNTSNSWADDSMDATSSWINPSSLNGDREKPEVAAPGSNTVRGGFYSTVPLSTSSSGWGNIGRGTSYAAPVVAGEAALLMQRQPILKTWPEIVKAIIMATAVGNPDGYAPGYQAGVDKKDGAGGIWMPYADNVARGVNGYWGGLPYSCSTASPLSFMKMNLAAGRLARAVIAWDQNSGYASYYTQPSADLDLQIIAPNGNLVAESSSGDNTYELASFTPSVSGTYTMRVIKYRCDLTPYEVGGAWSQP